MAITKSRQISKILSLDGKVKPESLDSDTLVASAQLGVQPAVGTEVYNTSSNLPVSANEGDQALVTSTNRLYIFTNGGWYNIALINKTPYWITEADGSYALSTTGGATIIEILAGDSDGTIPSYTATTDSDFNQIATITQDSDSRWIVIPTDSENGTAIAGTGTITFKATDGVNLVSTLSTFSLTFITAIDDSNKTTLLIKADDASTDNQIDASSNTHAITEVGNVTSTAFSPHHPGGYSTHFDGSNDYIQAASSADFGFGTGDFTVEWWANQSQLNGYSVVFAIGYGAGGLGSHMKSDGNITITRPGTAIDHTFTAGATETNTWYHVALVRSGTDLTCFVNGVSKGTITNSTNYAAGNLNIGIDGNGSSSPYNGYISDFRVVKGTAVYTSNFTTPTERLTAITNTSLLTCHLPYIADGSGNNHTVTANNGVSTERFAPYDYIPYTKTDHGGSVYFDGTGDYLSASNSTDFNIAGDLSWTIEGWWYWNSNSGEQVLIEKFTGGTGPGWTLYKLNGGPIGFYSGSSGAFSNAIHTVTTGQWYHVAVCRDATTDRTRAFINGKLKVDSTYSIGNNSSGNLYIGTRNGSGSYMNGYVSDVRVINGTALYTADFTPPTAPLTTITNTKLLTCTNKNELWEAAGSGKNIVKIGNGPTVSNTQRKFTTSSAILFNNSSSGDYLYQDLGEAVGTKDWTVEAWVYPTATNGSGVIQISPTSGTGLLSLGSSGSIGFGQQNGYWRVYTTGGWPVTGYLQSSTAVTINAWYHVASVRTGGNTKLYLNGTEIATRADTYDYSTTRYMALGCVFANNYVWPGYVQDYRITIGHARYTSNFTPPTEEFEG